MTDTRDIVERLPRPTWPAGFFGQLGADGYTADQMRAYAAEITRLRAEAEINVEALRQVAIALHEAGYTPKHGQSLAEALRAAPPVVPQWIPAHEQVPKPGTECVVLLRYTLDRPPFVGVDKWDIQREDPTGMGGPTIETGEGWNDNFESDVIAWIAIPPHPPAEWDQRLPATPPAPAQEGR